MKRTPYSACVRPACVRRRSLAASLLPGGGRAAVFCNRPEKTPRRGGLTLFEILLALGIFVGSMAALGQLLSNGVRGAVTARLQTQAILRCESVLSEIVAGVHPFQPASQVPFEDDPQWTWDVSIEASDYPGLFQLTCSVHHAPSDPSIQTGLTNISFTLYRLVRDPQVFWDGMAQEDAEAQALEQSSSGEGV